MKIDLDKIKRLYLEEKYTYNEIAIAMGVSSFAIGKRIRELGIKRTASETFRLRGSHLGSRNPAWRGGRKLRGDYIYVYKPDHPITKSRKAYSPYVPEHIVVWEETHGRLLPEGWMVHHLNGIKVDNRPQNLFAVPRKGHSPSLILKELQKRLRGVESELGKVKNQLKLQI